jgi:hypothetical protein
MSIYSKTLTNKAIASAAGLAMAFTSTSAVFADTTTSTADLTAQINSLLATIASLQAKLAAMQGGSSTTVGGFMVDLTIGSTGSDVTKLQTVLVSKGYLVMPAGVPMGYFGALTKAAVQKYQMAKGISPVSGYVGPLTRAALNAEAGSTTTGGTTTTGNEEGYLDNFDQDNSVSGTDIDEGDNNQEVVAVEADAKDADMTIDRVDVDFSSTGTGSKHLDRYIDSVSITLDGKTLATQDVSEADEDNDVYSFRFSGLGGVIKKGDTGRLAVEVDAVNSIDSADQRTWTATIPVDGIRAVDTAGISDTYANSAYDETFTVGAAASGDLTISTASDNPVTGDVEVSDNDTTDDVTLLVFKAKAKDSDVTVDSIPVTISTTGAGVGEVFKNVKLYKGSTLIDTENIASTTTFDNLDLTIDQDDTETFTVKADVKELGGGFTAGDSASSTLSTTNVGNIDAEDANGDSVTATGSATGNNQTFRSEGTSVSFTSSDVSVNTDATPDQGTYHIKFKVTAFGDDIYVGTTSSAFTVSNSNGTTTYSAGISSSADTDSASGAYIVHDGDSEDFTATVVVTGGNALNSVSLSGLKWGTTGANAYANTTTLKASDFQTDQEYLSNS